MSAFSSSYHKWWVLVGVGIASFLGCIDFTIVNTALPAIQQNLNATVIELQWIINIFILALSTCMVIMGRLADIYGRRLVLYIGMIIFGLASLGAGLSPTIHWLIFFRLIQGLSCAILYTATGAIVSHAFPKNEKGKAIGILFGINGIGLAIGPVLGGIIISLLSWRAIFLLNVPLILIGLLICFLFVSESRNEEMDTSIDWLGLLLLIIALTCFILAIIEAEQWGFTSITIISLFVISIITFILFYFTEMKVSSPIIQFHLFVNSTFVISIVATFSLAFFYCLAFFLMPLYLHTIRGETGFMIGMMLLPTTAAVAILSPIVGRAVDLFGPKIILLTGFGFFISSAFFQALFSTDSSLFHIILAFLFMGIGWACILGPSTVASLSSVPEHMGGIAMGSAWTCHNIGGAIGLALGTVIFRTFAQNTLIANLQQFGVTPGPWITKVLADPDQGITLLKKYLTLGVNEITSIFQHFFISGYRASMWLLVISSSIAFATIAIGMKNGK